MIDNQAVLRLLSIKYGLMKNNISNIANATTKLILES